MKKPRSTLRRTLAVIGVLVLCAPGMGWGLLQTRWMQGKILQRAEEINLPYGMRMELNGPGGTWPFRPEVSRVNVFDEEGVWLEANAVTTQWTAGWRSVQISRFHVEKLSMIRTPLVDETKPGSTDSQLPVLILLNNGEVESFNIYPEVLGGDVAGSIHVEGHVSPEDAAAEAILQSSLGKVLFQAKVNPAAGRGRMEFSGSLLDSLEVGAFLLVEAGRVRGQGSVSTEDILLTYSRAREAFTGKLPDFSLPGSPVIPVDALMNGVWEDGQLRGEVEMDSPFGIMDLKAKAGLEVKEDTIHLTIPEAEVTVLDSQLHLSEPLQVEVHEEEIRLDPVEWSWKEVRLEMAASVKVDQIDARFGVPAFCLSLLDGPNPVDLDGTLALNLTLDGTFEEPEVTWRLTGEDIRLDEDVQGPDLSVSLQSEGVWTSQQIQGWLGLTNRRGDTFSLEGEAAVPWSLSPFQVSDTVGGFCLKAGGRLDLSLFNALPAFPSIRVGGLVETSLLASKTKEDFSLAGSVEVREGVFEQFELGTVFRNIGLKGEWNQNRFDIVEGSAETPGGGRIRYQGSVQPRGKTWTGDLQAELDRARLIHLDAIQAALSGRIRLKKPEHSSAKVEGRLQLEETTFHMDRLPPARSAPLDVQILGREPVEAEVENPPLLSAPTFDISGSVQLDIPGTLRVEGGNIQSRWEGTLRTSLEKEGIMLTGRLQPRRGNVMFFSRSFALDRDGEILFSDVLGTPPILDLIALHTRRDLEASLRISGRATSPRFRLESDPPYPETEIISRILFGRDMSTITALQALEVGLALNSMRDNTRSDWDVMGRAREALRVDQLEIRETGDAEGNPELMAGRQISERVYLEVQQNLREPGTTVRMEVEVGRNVSVESESGTHIRPGIGVSWRKDY